MQNAQCRRPRCVTVDKAYLPPQMLNGGHRGSQQKNLAFCQVNYYLSLQILFVGC